MRLCFSFLNYACQGFLHLCAASVVSILPAEAPSDDRPLPAVVVTIDGTDEKDLSQEIKIPTVAKTMMFQIGDLVWNVQDSRAARFRFMLEGVDSEWQRRTGDMGLAIFFYDKKYSLIKQCYFTVSNDSPHWNGTLDPSNLTHRIEKLIVPPGADKLSLIVTSAGPPDTFGVYVLQGFVLHRNENGRSETIFQLGSAIERIGNRPDGDPVQWMRDGTHPSMAYIEHLKGLGSGTDVLCIMDDDPLAHAAWHLIDRYYPKVHPGEVLTLDWNEMYSVGLCNVAVASYSVPKPGVYHFLVNTVDVMGNPLKQSSIKIVVYTPYWMNPWLWAGCVLVFSVLLFFTGRQVIRSRIRKQLYKIEQEHMVERERLRIARDLHDDLGARLTHISLVSSSWKKESFSLENAGDNFRKISEMTRDLISALYETVWTVDPSNDQLHALVDHIIQMTDAMCGMASIKCRIKAPVMPIDYPVAGSLRHNLILAVKEALHNAIKHSAASEIVIQFEWQPPILTVGVSDNGQGFTVKDKTGHRGLSNIHGRIAAINGFSHITSVNGGGTQVVVTVPIPSPIQEPV